MLMVEILRPPLRDLQFALNNPRIRHVSFLVLACRRQLITVMNFHELTPDMHHTGHPATRIDELMPWNFDKQE
jgi:hypothetical protein